MIHIEAKNAFALGTNRTYRARRSIFHMTER